MLENAGIIKQVTYSDWATPIVTVPKADGIVGFVVILKLKLKLTTTQCQKQKIFSQHYAKWWGEIYQIRSFASLLTIAFR